jgi:riboflavin transporter FmnP
MDAFTGDVAQIIIGICFAGSCVAYAFNKDNEKMKGKIVAVVVATGLLALCQVIVEKVFQGAGG